MNSPGTTLTTTGHEPALISGEIRLNLGGRNTKIPGFTNVDITPHASVDIVADIADLSMIKDKSVLEIYSSHCLEHFPHGKTLDVLKEWHRVMVPGGKCYVAVPDFEALVQAYLGDGLVQFIVDLGWGGQEYKEAFHYAPFDFPRLANLLMKAGFEDIQRIGPMPYRLADCSALIETRNFTPISLNVLAIA